MFLLLTCSSRGQQHLRPPVALSQSTLACVSLHRAAACLMCPPPPPKKVCNLGPVLLMWRFSRAQSLRPRARAVPGTAYVRRRGNGMTQTPVCVYGAQITAALQLQLGVTGWGGACRPSHVALSFIAARPDTQLIRPRGLPVSNGFTRRLSAGGTHRLHTFTFL